MSRHIENSRARVHAVDGNIILQQGVWKIKNYIRKSCSAAAKWKRKFSVAGGKWCSFKLSNVILESSHWSARAAKLARISLVLTEISCELMSGCQIQDVNSWFQTCVLRESHLDDLTVWPISILRRLHDEKSHVFVQLPHSHGLCGVGGELSHQSEGNAVLLSVESKGS